MEKIGRECRRVETREYGRRLKKREKDDGSERKNNVKREKKE